MANKKKTCSTCGGCGFVTLVSEKEECLPCWGCALGAKIEKLENKAAKKAAPPSQHAH